VTPVLRELSTPEEVLALEPVVLEYFRIISGELRDRYALDLPPEGPVATMMAAPERVLPPLGGSFVAEADGRLLGMVFLKPLGRQDVEVKRLYVRPEARGTGLAKRLVETVIDAARAMGAGAIYLDTLQSLTPAITLYERAGFDPVPVYEGSEIADHPEIVAVAAFMKKTLSP
jgi:GNAT superfamily N-acetyltransferase